MSLASRMADFAQRVGRELHDTRWEDLSAHLLPGYSGLLRGRARAGIISIQGDVAGTFDPANSPATFTTALPERFRPSKLGSGSHIYATGVFTPFNFVGGGCIIRPEGSLAWVLGSTSTATRSSMRFAATFLP